MKSAVRIFCLSILILAVPCILSSQAKQSGKPVQPASPDKSDPLQGSPKIVTATKGVQQFWDIESALAQALKKKDQSALGKMTGNTSFRWFKPIG